MIAAHAMATLVASAHTKSGSMVTARFVQNLHRPLAVVPGGPEDLQSRGCLQLMQEGAQGVSDWRDLDIFWTSSLQEGVRSMGLDQNG